MKAIAMSAPPVMVEKRSMRERVASVASTEARDAFVRTSRCSTLCGSVGMGRSRSCVPSLHSVVEM